MGAAHDDIAAVIDNTRRRAAALANRDCLGWGCGSSGANKTTYSLIITCQSIISSIILLITNVVRLRSPKSITTLRLRRRHFHLTLLSLNNATGYPLCFLLGIFILCSYRGGKTSFIMAFQGAALPVSLRRGACPTNNVPRLTNFSRIWRRPPWNHGLPCRKWCQFPGDKSQPSPAGRRRRRRS